MLKKVKKYSKIGLSVMGLLAVTVFAGCSQDESSIVDKDGNFKQINTEANNQNNRTGQDSIKSEYVVDRGDFVKGHNLIDGIAKGVLDKEEEKGLIQMREEEKLARDVYKTLYQKWEQSIFDNISGSEQTHMTAIGDLLTRYNLEDPIKDDMVGKFTSPELQKLYNELIAKGNKSLVDALQVGATIEDLDIYDLEKFLKTTDQDDIKVVYQNLNKGSRNHLRAFMRNLERNGGSYKPQFISQARFDEILSGEQERGAVDAYGKATNRDGQGLGRGQGRGQGDGSGVGRSQNQGQRGGGRGDGRGQGQGGGNGRR